MACLAPILSVGLVAGCEPPSRFAIGREDIVRYSLPPGAMAVLENADSFEVFAIQRPEPDARRVHHDRPYDQRLDDDEVALARVQVDGWERDRLIESTYQSIAGGLGAAVCYFPFHAIRARRGEEVVEFSISPGCLQLRFRSPPDDSGRPTGVREISPGPIGGALDRVFAAHTTLRLESPGVWVDSAVESAPDE